jgi:hypothetical protein
MQRVLSLRGGRSVGRVFVIHVELMLIHGCSAASVVVTRGFAEEWVFIVGSEMFL